MGTRYQGTREEVTALNAYICLVRAAESVSARLHGHLAEHGLTVSQFGTLEAVLHLGPLTQRELSRKLLKTGGNTTLVLDNLEKRGLVVRERKGADRRCNSVRLTEEGRRLISRIFPRHVKEIVREMASLKPREQESLRRLCRTLGRTSAGPDGPVKRKERRC